MTRRTPATTSASRGLKTGDLVLQRKCACGNRTNGSSQCETCADKKKALRRRASGEAGGDVPAIVHQVLRSPGEPLDTQARAFMEPRFGRDFAQIRTHTSEDSERQMARTPHMEAASIERTNTDTDARPPAANVSDAGLHVTSADGPLEREADRVANAVVTRAPSPTSPRYDFSDVRVHTGTAAAAAAQAVQADAFTVGNHLVFDAGRYLPSSREGRHLLAHELAHVVQQGGEVSHGAVQRQQRRPRLAPIDANAQQIVDAAQNTSTPIEQRAVAVVQAIINQYFPDQANKVSRIVYDKSEPGLSTTYTSEGADATGVITVGNYFVENTTQKDISRRVLQVRHEIEHVDQIRSGMAGDDKKHEREFLAFYHEALAQELPGTGRMQQSTRVHLIDGALGHYYCLDAAKQKENASRRDELLTRRADAVKRSGRKDIGEAPTSCPNRVGFGVLTGIGGALAIAGGIGLGIGLRDHSNLGIGLGIAGLGLGALGLGFGIAGLAGAFDRKEKPV